MFTWSASLFEKKRFAAVLIIASLSPTDTIALASTRTLIGRGLPLSSMSAVWSVMSRSTLMTLLEIVVPVVARGSVLGVLDLDSPILGRFDDAHAAALEALVADFVAATDL